MSNCVLEIKGNVNVEGKEIRRIEGGFGEGQKCMLAADIAEQHKVKTDDVNRLIKRNFDRFNEKELIDFLNGSDEFRVFAKENGLITSNRTKNIYLLSERGYTKLVAMMDNTNEKKWEIMDKLIDGYFRMREVLEAQYKLPTTYKEALLQLVEAEEEKERLLLEKKVVDEALAIATPKANFHDKWFATDHLYTVKEIAKVFAVPGLGLVNFYKWLRESKIVEKEARTPYQRYINNGYCKQKTVAYTYFNKKDENGDTIEVKTTDSYILFTPKGVNYLYKKLVKDGYIIPVSLEEAANRLNSKDADNK